MHIKYCYYNSRATYLGTYLVHLCTELLSGHMFWRPRNIHLLFIFLRSDIILRTLSPPSVSICLWVFEFHIFV